MECYDGKADHPVFIALRETVKRHDIPIDPLRDLLTAFMLDVTKNRYDTFMDLMGYCKCSANPVGRLVLMIFNYREESIFEFSDYICTALQLTNFWQDADVDRQKNRLYIPLEDLKHFNYSLSDWEEKKVNNNLNELMKFQVDRTKDLFYKGAKLPSLVTKDLQLELKLIWFGGMEILRMIEKQKYNTLDVRPSLGNSAKLKVFINGLFRNKLETYRKKQVKKDLWDLT
jgi:squalene synthase HpnC